MASVARPLDADPFAGIEIVSHARAARRLRLRVAGLVGNQRLAERLEHRLAQVPGVTRVQASVRSGRVLLAYDDPAPTRLWPSSPPKRRARPSVLERLRDRVTPPPPAGASVERDRSHHALAVEEALALLASSRDGLTDEEAHRRLREVGANVIAPAETRSLLQRILPQIANLPVGLLAGSAALSALLGDVVDAAAIAVVIALNAGIGFLVEEKSEQLLASWRKLEAGTAEVVRAGQLRTVPASELVPGDILLVRAGDVLAADGRVLEAEGLVCDEATLTGESLPVEKSGEPVAAEAPLAERASMVWSGTRAVSGLGRVLVTATGGATQVGRVRGLVEEARAPETPLTRKLGKLGDQVSWLSVGAAGVAAATGFLRGRSPGEVLRGSVALGVAAIPEGLPVVATASLVRSMQRLRAHGVVVRRLASAETLGGVTTVCADKTGTLTANEMRVTALWLDGRVHSPKELRARAEAPFGDPISSALAALALNSDVMLLGDNGQRQVSGSSTERALVRAAEDAGLDLGELRERYPRTQLVERKPGVSYVVTLHATPHNDGGSDGGSDGLALVKGAPEQVVELCTRVQGRPLDARARRRILDANEALAARGLRVLGVARRPMDAGTTQPPTEGYELLGLCGLEDPVREGAAEALAAAKRAGIRTVIVTGDQRRTAQAVARAVGLDGEALDAAELDAVLRLPKAEQRARLRGVAVVARVAPADKLRLVRALKESGEVVAMVGDGVNDAAALKAAHVGVAVGLSSSDLARGVADVVLAEPDLRGMLIAVGEGRIVQDNLRRALSFLCATNLSEVGLVLGGALLGRDVLQPLQLLWINLLTDTLPALALALEPGRPDLLDRPPSGAQAPLVDARAFRRIAKHGAVMAGVGAAGFLLGGPALAFSSLVGAQLGYTFLCRAQGAAIGPRFLQLWGAAAGLQATTLLVQPLRGLLGLGAPSVLEVGGFALDALGLWWLQRRDEVIVREGAARPRHLLLPGGLS